MSYMKYTTSISAVIVLCGVGMLLAYCSGYLLLIDRVPRNDEGLIFPRYRLGGAWSVAFFRPLFQIERRLRPDVLIDPDDVDFVIDGPGR